jgi:hypothetical protein
MDQDIPKGNYPRPWCLWVRIVQRFREAGSGFSDHCQLLHDGAAEQFGLAESTEIDASQEIRNVVGRLDDVAQVKLLTPHRGFALR